MPAADGGTPVEPARLLAALEAGGFTRCRYEERSSAVAAVLRWPTFPDLPAYPAPLVAVPLDVDAEYYEFMVAAVLADLRTAVAVGDAARKALAALTAPASRCRNTDGAPVPVDTPEILLRRTMILTACRDVTATDLDELTWEQLERLYEEATSQ